MDRRRLAPATALRLCHTSSRGSLPRRRRAGKRHGRRATCRRATCPSGRSAAAAAAAAVRAHHRSSGLRPPHVYPVRRDEPGTLVHASAHRGALPLPTGTTRRARHSRRRPPEGLRHTSRSCLDRASSTYSACARCRRGTWTLRRCRGGHHRPRSHILAAAMPSACRAVHRTRPSSSAAAVQRGSCQQAWRRCARPPTAGCLCPRDWRGCNRRGA